MLYWFRRNICISSVCKLTIDVDTWCVLRQDSRSIVKSSACILYLYNDNVHSNNEKIVRIKFLKYKIHNIVLRMQYWEYVFLSVHIILIISLKYYINLKGWSSVSHLFKINYVYNIYVYINWYSWVSLLISIPKPEISWIFIYDKIFLWDFEVKKVCCKLYLEMLIK